MTNDGIQEPGHQRIPSLDGLRGAAALVVLLHHSMLLVPQLAAPYLTGAADDTSPLNWLVTTPAHLAWAGTEAVYLFFVLSGVVLVRQVQDAASYRWDRYFPARMIRLYAPVVCVVVLVAVWREVQPIGNDTGNPWLDTHLLAYNPHDLLADLTLLTGNSGVITPLWSLQWEVLFSLALPLVVLLGRTRWTWMAVPISLALCWVGFLTGLGSLAYLPMFVVGAVVGRRHDDIRRWFDSRSTVVRHLFGSVTVIVGALLTCSYWLVLPAFPEEYLIWAATRPLVVVGVTLIVMASMSWSPARRVLAGRPLRIAGAISFSLYLVHEPIVVAVGQWDAPARFAIPVAITGSLVVAAVFYAAIERPSHRLARHIGASGLRTVPR